MYKKLFMGAVLCFGGAQEMQTAGGFVVVNGAGTPGAGVQISLLASLNTSFSGSTTGKLLLGAGQLGIASLGLYGAYQTGLLTFDSASSGLNYYGSSDQTGMASDALLGASFKTTGTGLACFACSELAIRCAKNGCSNILSAATDIYGGIVSVANGTVSSVKSAGRFVTSKAGLYTLGTLGVAALGLYAQNVLRVSQAPEAQ